MYDLSSENESFLTTASTLIIYKDSPVAVSQAALFCPTNLVLPGWLYSASTDSHNKIHAVRTSLLQATEAPWGVAERTVVAEYMVWQDAMSQFWLISRLFAL
jgi:hypothetical protein